ncbi:MAG TPA: glycerol-3-phosphate dehydrogenase/oxidase [Woeseiaceae bacterium]|nr:glycerol-3-phosphate dehydrogenase/oxidase [Woeseiaceae bacterium]
MKDRRRELADEKFDVLVIGAGMFGACIAWSAALRGYSVAVIDKGDFAGATSSNHYKFIHGGIRYLQHLDIVRLRESAREKSALIRTAPHLAYPMPIVFPTYGHGRRGKFLMWGAMLTYDLLTLDRNRGIGDPTRRTPNGSLISRKETLKLFPGTPQEGLTGAAIFYDGQMYNPARLVLAYLHSAAARGALIANYVNADRLIRENNEIVGCLATDGLSGEQFNIRSRIVVNAAGPWGHLLLRDDPALATSPEPSFSRDLAFVVKKSINEAHAIGCQSATADSDAVLDRGGRHLFLVPWRGMTLVGVWHRYTLGDPDNIHVSTEELQDFIDEINGTYGGLNLHVDDISFVNTGHILFGDESAQGSEKEHSFAKRSLLIDHSKNGIKGLITVVGARATVARGIAEKTMNLVQRNFGDAIRRSDTETVPIHGGLFDDFSALVDEIRHKLPTGSEYAAKALAHNYGSEYGAVLECADEPDLLRPVGDSAVLKAEAIHAIRNEMAQTLADIVLRRTELGSGGDPGQDAIRELAETAAGEFGWDGAELDSQIQLVQAILKRGGPWHFVDKLPEEEFTKE